MYIDAMGLLLLLVLEGSATIQKKLNYFETLKTVDISSRKRRSTDGRESSFSEEISFQALGRRFNLVLQMGSPVLAPDFQAKVVLSNGKTVPFHLNRKNFFTGHLAEDKSVLVDGHFEEGILSSSIRFPNETYVIEPAWRHLPPSDNHTMIAYRGSDVRWDDVFPDAQKPGERKKFSDGIRLDLEEQSDGDNVSYDNKTTKTAAEASRKKRAALARNTCPLLVVADYLFYSSVGGGKREATAHYIIGVIQKVDTLFKETLWDEADGLVKMGFQIKEMLIHTDYTPQPGHYNENVIWGVRDKLDAFSREKKLNNFCLGHLFTSYPFDGNVLGLAFIAPESLGSAGGICSVSSRIRSATIYPRTGWSSAKNAHGENILTLQFQLVTAHELGHNWGSEHDPDTDECGPSSRDKGKYVMWPYAVSGWDDNNKFFSPCSRRLIAPVLRAKSSLCFIEPVEGEGICGNGLIDKGEECDVGFQSEDSEDPCCTSSCKLRPRAKCSDFNFACCENCAIAATTTVCEAESKLSCMNRTFCDGKHLTCPKATPAQDGTKCIGRGECFNGTCMSYCHVKGKKEGRDLEPCICDQNTTAACRWCCAEMKDGVKGECFPTDIKLSQGQTCYIGYCSENGVCVQVQQQLIQRIFDFIQDLDPSKLVKFMRSNVVGTIMVMSLIVWIPASWIFSCVDKREIKKEDEYLKRWVSREHSILGRSRDDLSHFHIKKSRFRQLPHENVVRGAGDAFGFPGVIYLAQPSHRQTVSSDVFTYDPEMLNIRSTDILDGSSGDIKADSSNTTEEFPAVQKDADAILPRGTATI
ncbi:ADAM 17-like protease isoform X2 [Pomacea canaliculata]|uniref:ADAM 17-like protease isoform X2 n=1 Tax=Pomacea canaliculata TaxID=400727 RepID=UPI000D734148|nr:ADAM 17-like protease isoform X2 [Pomacea canaliculata]